MTIRVLGDRKRIRYDEGLIDVVNQMYSSSQTKTPPSEEMIVELSKGKLVFNQEGYLVGIIRDSDPLISGPDDRVALVILTDGSLQNPNGTRSNITCPIEYLRKNVTPIKEAKYHISRFKK